MKHSAAIPIVQKHQAQYFYEVSKWLNGTIFSKYKIKNTTKTKDKIEFMDAIENEKLSFVMAGARSGNSPIYTLPCAGQSASVSKKMVWIWHSFLVEKMCHKFLEPKGLGQYSVLPEYFNSVLGVEKKKDIVFYEGHYMSAFHLTNPPEYKCKDHILYLPLIGTDPNSVAEDLKKLKTNFKIRLHPGEYLKCSIGRSSDKRVGVSEYKKIFGEERVIEKNESILKSIDECSGVISNYPSSTLIESVIRGSLFGVDRKIVVTARDQVVYRKSGISFCKNPKTERDFGLIDKRIVDQCIQPYDLLKKNFTHGIIDALKKDKLSDEEIYSIRNKFYFPNIG